MSIGCFHFDWYAEGNRFASALRADKDFAPSSRREQQFTGLVRNLSRMFSPFEDVGAIIDRPENVPLTNLGMVVRQSINDIPSHYPAITVDHAVIMPNHTHLLLQINTDADGRSMIAPTISTVVRLIKGAVSKQAGFPVWQKGFYDHVIRNENDYREIWKYIEGNPGK